jgi:signal transduction histidine kinase
MRKESLLASKSGAVIVTSPDLDRFVTSMHEVVNSDTKAEAIRSIVRLCSVQFEAPAAAWHDAPDEAALLLASSSGLDADSNPDLEAEMRLVSVGDRTPAGLLNLRKRFAAITGRQDAIALAARDVLILIGSPEDHPIAPVGFEALISQILDLVDEVNHARKRSRDLDISLALTAHELRGPLLSAKAAIETSLFEETHHSESSSIDRGANITGQLLLRANHELGHLADMCDSLLSWAADENSVEFDPVDVAEVVLEAIGGCTHERNAERLSFTRPAQPVRIHASEEQIRVAVSNLLRNALYYSPAHRPVTVSVETFTSVVHIVVTDDGPGVPMGQHRSIFDPFVRGLGGDTPRSGRGLGLFIAKRVVEGHEGRIWVDSRERGARFVIELPLAEEQL